MVDIQITNKNKNVNKIEFIEHMAAWSDISKAAAIRAPTSILQAVKKPLKKATALAWSALALSASASVLHAWALTRAQALL